MISSLIAPRRRGSRARARLLAPLYVHPAIDTEPWRRIADGAFEGAQLVVNVADGPGEACDHAYVSVLDAARRAGVTPLGYVDMAYGATCLDEMLDLAHRWLTWYGVRHLFVDQVPTHDQGLALSRRLADAVRPTPLVLNHGAEPSSPLPVPNAMHVTFEGSWSDYSQYRPSWQWREQSAACAHLVYDCPANEVVAAARRSLGHGVGRFFISSGSLPNPWCSLPAALIDL